MLSAKYPITGTVSLRLPCRTRQVLYAFYEFRTGTRQLQNFCKTSKPEPDFSVSSARTLNPIEHTRTLQNTNLLPSINVQLSS